MVINQLIPFGSSQFDATMSFLSGKHSQTLTQLEMVKLHVMTDVFHLIEYGKPVIGGPLERWPHGPVVDPAYRRLARFGKNWLDFDGQQPDAPYQVIRHHGKKFDYLPTMEVEADDFSGSQIRAMDRAWRCVIGGDHGMKTNDFFHSPKSFMGLVWTRAGEGKGVPIAWIDILNAYEELKCGPVHRHVRQLLSA